MKSVRPRSTKTHFCVLTQQHSCPLCQSTVALQGAKGAADPANADLGLLATEGLLAAYAGAPAHIRRMLEGAITRAAR